MSSHAVQIENRRVLLPVYVLDPTQPGGSLNHRRFDALVDTGATTSMVSPRVVQQLGIPIRGTDKFMPATGVPTETSLHSVALAVPTSTEPDDSGDNTTLFSIRDGLVVLKMPKPLIGFDVVIGMDVLENFHTRMGNAVFTISSEALTDPRAEAEAATLRSRSHAQHTALLHFARTADPEVVRRTADHLDGAAADLQQMLADGDLASGGRTSEQARRDIASLAEVARELRSHAPND